MYICNDCIYFEYTIEPLHDADKGKTVFMQSILCRKGNSARIKLKFQEEKPCDLYTKRPKPRPRYKYGHYEMIKKINTNTKEDLE